jgi:hypothetical protein
MLDRIALARAKARAHAWQLIEGTAAGFPWLAVAGKTLTGLDPIRDRMPISCETACARTASQTPIVSSARRPFGASARAAPAASTTGAHSQTVTSSNRVPARGGRQSADPRSDYDSPWLSRQRRLASSHRRVYTPW